MLGGERYEGMVDTAVAMHLLDLASTMQAICASWHP